MDAQTTLLTPRHHPFDHDRLLRSTEAATIAELWSRLRNRVYAIPIRRVSQRDYDRTCPGDDARILSAADLALAHRIESPDSASIDLGSPIRWHAGAGAADVWELSRLHWLIPAGQAYLLTGDERYAGAVREVLDDWMAGNPYGQGVNWTCTAEVALRLLSWTWFFHVCGGTQEWSDKAFQRRFLGALLLHGEFAHQNRERSDVMSHHPTANAVGLVFAGLFFGKSTHFWRRAEEGWQRLCEGLSGRTSPDGAAVPTSATNPCLELELRFLAARYREACGLPVPDPYRAHLVEMARAALTKEKSIVPAAPHAADAEIRALPFGGRAVGDHRHLVGLVGTHWHVRDLARAFSGSRAEIVWALGRRAAAVLPAEGRSAK